MPVNATLEQDHQITAAKADEPVSNLVAIIEDLDSQLSEWREAADCASPEELKSLLAGLETEDNHP